MKEWSLDFRQELKTKEDQMHLNIFPNGVSKFVARKYAPIADKIFSSSLNGSDLEQIVHNIIGRFSIEWVEIWNECLWWNSVVASHSDWSSWMYLQYHLKTNKRDQRAPEYDPLFYVSD